MKTLNAIISTTLTPGIAEQVKSEIAESILSRLESKRFAEWYNNGAFDHYISGDLPTVSKEEILAAVKDMFVE
jgi:hypothetical protein